VAFETLLDRVWGPVTGSLLMLTGVVLLTTTVVTRKTARGEPTTHLPNLQQHSGCQSPRFLGFGSRGPSRLLRSWATAASRDEAAVTAGVVTSGLAGIHAQLRDPCDAGDGDHHTGTDRSDQQGHPQRQGASQTEEVNLDAPCVLQHEDNEQDQE
jgi:hypothetical protein